MGKSDNAATHERLMLTQPTLHRSCEICSDAWQLANHLRGMESIQNPLTRQDQQTSRPFGPDHNGRQY